MKLLLRTIITALAFALAANLVPGIRIDGVFTLLLAAFIWGILNAVVRPVLLILTMPITIITLGIFIFVLNAILFALTAWFLPGFHVDNFGSAFLGWLIITLVSWVASKFLDDNA
jgi:putative membrane protein